MDFNVKAKYQAMLRAYKKLKKVNTNTGNRISNTDAKDATESFFNQCYHLKDWIIQENIDLKEDVENYINKSNSLSLAADYCNSFKHAGLRKKTRSGKKLEALHTHIKIDLTSSGFTSSSKLDITIDGKKYDAYKLATECLNEWGAFFALYKIDINI